MISATPVPGTPAHPTAAPKVRTFAIDGPAGRLEAVLNEGRSDAPVAALLCHPHPLGGGNLHNKVVYHAMKAMNAPEWGLNWPVLRFNFRGTGLSEGEHHGAAESADVLSALDWLRAAYSMPIVVVGFSFGAAMALAATCAQFEPCPSDVRALAALGLPLRAGGRHYSYPFLAACQLPKLFLSGDRDQFADAGELAELVRKTAEPHRLVLIPGADHFFTGQLAPMQSALCEWLKEFA